MESLLNQPGKGRCVVVSRKEEREVCYLCQIFVKSLYMFSLLHLQV
jgi:hypothetical protein